MCVTPLRRAHDRRLRVGTLHYGRSGVGLQLSDRFLAHLQLAINSKLRRGQSFALSWTLPVELGSGRMSVWIDASIPLRYHYDDTTLPVINRQWVDHLVRRANSPQGLELTDDLPS